MTKTMTALIPPGLNRGVERTEAIPSAERDRKPVSPGGGTGEESPRPDNQLGDGVFALVDWLSVTFPVTGEDRQADYLQAARELLAWILTGNAQDRLCLVDALVGPGHNFYRQRIYVPGVEVNFDGTPEMGMNVVITGTGCRQLEETRRVKQWPTFLRQVTDRQGRIARIDVAVDDRRKKDALSLDKLWEAWDAGHVTAHYQTAQMQTARSRAGAGVGRPAIETLYFGDPRQGGSGIRVYDKQRERVAKGHANPGRWIRVELVAKGEQARQLANAIIDRGLAAAAAGAILGKLAFRIPHPSDSNKRRWEIATWWTDFLQQAKAIQLTTTQTLATLTRKAKWLVRQGSRALATLAQAYPDRWQSLILEPMLRHGAARLTNWDRQLIAEALALGGVSS